MVAIVEAIDLVTGDPPSAPLSLAVAPDEIVGLLFPPVRPRVPILRALAGLDATVAGEVRFPGRRRILLATPGPPLSDALSSHPDLVVLDAEQGADHSTWVRLATERARGTSFVVATASVDQASRSDRISLASWEMDELTRAIQELVRQMTSQVQEFLAVLGEGQQHHRSASLAADLRRLNVGSRALLGEMRLCARDREDHLVCETAEEHIAGASVSDRLLDAVIAETQDR